MIFASVCSGIESASVAWGPLGWRAAFLAEIDPAPSAVLAHHYLEVPNLGDFTQIGRWSEPVRLLVGGTPCQSFSVAGKRGGLDDPRGNLAIEFLRLAARLRPVWVVWENVPGVLSSGGGRDFGTFLGLLGELGYGFAYRVLDAQFAGVPQRRRRVFVVGHLGDWRRAAAVLFEREGLCGHPPPRREAGAGIAASLEASLGRRNGQPNCSSREGLLIPAVGRERTSHGGRMDGDSETFIPELANSCRTQDRRIGQGWNQTMVAHTLRADGFDASEDGTGRGTPLYYSHDYNQDRVYSDSGVTPAITASDSNRSRNHFVGSTVRRLTPRECERLQGFPDDWTLVPYRGKPMADGPRYKMIGNSMAVPVVAWVGRRIQMVEAVR